MASLKEIIRSILIENINTEPVIDKVVYTAYDTASDEDIKMRGFNVGSHLINIQCYDNNGNLIIDEKSIKGWKLKDIVGEPIANVIRDRISYHMLNGTIDKLSIRTPKNINDIEEINSIAKQVFTPSEYQPGDNGFILTDGTFIKLTEEEHEDLQKYITGVNLDHFLELGNIRISSRYAGNNCAIEIWNRPTFEQKSALYKPIGSTTNLLGVEVYDPETGDSSFADYADPDPKIVLNQIERYYNEGIDLEEQIINLGNILKEVTENRSIDDVNELMKNAFTPKEYQLGDNGFILSDGTFVSLEEGKYHDEVSKYIPELYLDKILHDFGAIRISQRGNILVHISKKPTSDQIPTLYKVLGANNSPIEITIEYPPYSINDYTMGVYINPEPKIIINHIKRFYNEGIKLKSFYDCLYGNYPPPEYDPWKDGYPTPECYKESIKRGFKKILKETVHKQLLEHAFKNDKPYQKYYNNILIENIFNTIKTCILLEASELSLHQKFDKVYNSEDIDKLLQLDNTNKKKFAEWILKVIPNDVRRDSPKEELNFILNNGLVLLKELFYAYVNNVVQVHSYNKFIDAYMVYHNIKESNDYNRIKPVYDDGVISIYQLFSPKDLRDILSNKFLKNADESKWCLARRGNDALGGLAFWEEYTNNNQYDIFLIHNKNQNKLYLWNNNPEKSPYRKDGKPFYYEFNNGGNVSCDPIKDGNLTDDAIAFLDNKTNGKMSEIINYYLNKN